MDTPRIIDIHAHIRFADDPIAVDETQPIGATGLVDALRIDGVEHATAIVMAFQGELEATATRNDLALAAAAETEGFLIPMVSVHPADGDDAIAELDRVAALGARMLKLHPNTQSFDVADDAVARVVQRAGEHDMIVLFDGWSPFDPAQPGKFLMLALTCPQTRLILAHMNGLGFADLIAFHVAAKYSFWPGNVYHDLSATCVLVAGSPYEEQFRWIVRKIGTDKILYGSDFPLYGEAEALAAVRSLGFTPEEEHQILYANAAGLLGL